MNTKNNKKDGEIGYDFWSKEGYDKDKDYAKYFDVGDLVEIRYCVWFNRRNYICFNIVPTGLLLERHKTDKQAFKVLLFTKSGLKQEFFHAYWFKKVI